MGTFFRRDEKTATVETTKGKVQGYILNDICVFKGIPYARARRFHAPEPVEGWTDVFDACSFGFVCPLFSLPRPNGELYVPHRYWPMDEDCLNLNLWTPGCDDKKRPVMVWLHGGGYESGSAIEHIAYEGENMSRYGDVVTVTVNHRLNILGYLDLSDFGDEYVNSGNAGGDDIIAALKWVRDNVERFGGDPENVTVFGQSGGGGKVTTLLQSPDADGLYAKAICMSGVWEQKPPVGEEGGKALVQSLMKELSVKRAGELETVPYSRLAAAYEKIRPAFIRENRYVGNQPFKNAFYAGDPLIYGFRRETEQIPVLAGSVFGEFSSFAPGNAERKTAGEEEQLRLVEAFFGKEHAAALAPLFREAYPEHPLCDLVRLDHLFRPATQKYIRLRSARNACTWSYLFDHEMPIDGGTTPWHCAEIPYVFHNTQFVPSTQEEGVEKLEKLIFDSVMAFARTGDPGHPGLPSWPASTPELEQTMIFDDRPFLHTNHDRELMPLFEAYMKPIFDANREQITEKAQH